MDNVKTAYSSATKFTKRDTVIVWTDKVHTQIIDNFIMKNTYPIVLTKPYQYSETKRRTRYKIYQDNLNFFKRLYSGNINTKHVIECNAVLQGSKYSAEGQYITNTGKWFIGKEKVY